MRAALALLICTACGGSPFVAAEPDADPPTIAFSSEAVSLPPVVVASTSTVETTTIQTTTSTTTIATSTSTVTVASSLACALANDQCGGINWSGATCCATPDRCVVLNPYYSQCQP